MNIDKSLKYSKTVVGFLTAMALHIIQVSLPELGVQAPGWLSGNSLSVLSVLQWIAGAIGIIGARQAIGQAIAANKTE